jgi:hypothetical protein
MLINVYCLPFIDTHTIEMLQELKNSFIEKQLKIKFVKEFLW